MRSAILLMAPAVWLALAQTGAGDETKPEWAVDVRQRIAVVVVPRPETQLNTPTGVSLDFQTIFRENGIAGRLDQNSIRLVRSADAGVLEAPYRLTGDFANDDAGTIWW